MKILPVSYAQLWWIIRENSNGCNTRCSKMTRLIAPATMHDPLHTSTIFSPDPSNSYSNGKNCSQNHHSFGDLKSIFVPKHTAQNRVFSVNKKLKMEEVENKKMKRLLLFFFRLQRPLMWLPWSSLLQRPLILWM